MFAARDAAQQAPKPPEPWRHLTDAVKTLVKGTFSKWAAYRKGTLEPPDRVRALVEAQREYDRKQFARATNAGTAFRGMSPETPVAHTSGLPEWVRYASTLYFHHENGQLCPPGDWPAPLGNRPAMWYGKPSTRPFELKGNLDAEALDFELGCAIWRPGESRLLPSPDSPLPEP